MLTEREETIAVCRASSGDVPSRIGYRMLNLARNPEEPVIINDNIEVCVFDIQGRSVKLGAHIFDRYILAAAKTGRENLGRKPISRTGQRGLSDSSSGGDRQSWRIAR